MEAFILRRLKINDDVYYQLIDKVEGKEIDDRYIKVIKGERFEGKDIESIDNQDNEIVYIKIDSDLSKNYNANECEFFKQNQQGEIDIIQDLVERNNVIMAFYNKYKDFRISPDYNLEEMIKTLELNMHKMVIGQDKVIEKISKKIYSNQMCFKSDLDINIMRKNKSNILVMGPRGTGKTTLKEAMLDNLYPIPIVEVKLGTDYIETASIIVKKLIDASDGNLYLAQRGIIIFDNINSENAEFSKDEDGLDKDNLQLKALQDLMKENNILIRINNKEMFQFDLSLVTYVCFIDTYYDEEIQDEENEHYYSKMSLNDYTDLGISNDLLIDYFDNEVIYMNEMTKELALKILKDKELSPLYQFKKALESEGKTMRVSKNFVKVLIEHGLDEEGFAGVKRFFKYALESKDLTLKNIVFKDTDIKNLQIGSAGVNDLDELTLLKKNKNNTVNTNDMLDVDIKNKTINGLHVMDVVNIIKKEFKGQDEHIFRIVNAYYNHVLNQHKGFDENEYKKLKQNVFLIANPGVGKTGIFEALARVFNTPFKRDSINSYTSSGYVGKSVDDLITGLIAAANGSIEKAQFGILGLDEFDKLARNNNDIGFGKKVQEELLTLIEGDVREIQEDIFSEPYKFNTEYLFIVLMGACQDIDQVINNRIKSKRKAGFATNQDEKISTEVTREDLLAYGFEDQLLGRIPNIIRLNNLTVANLLEIIKSEKGYVNLICKSYLKSGIKINMTEEFMVNLATAAYNLGTGARGIRSLFERLVTEIDKNNQNGNISIVNIGDNALNDFNDITYVERKSKVKTKVRMKKTR